jgi:hypothetical protein
MQKDTGARWDITVDGVPRSFHDRKEKAIESAKIPQEHASYR